MDKRTIRNCNVAVIGGAGFLGSHLVNHLIEDRGCAVLVVDNLCAGRLDFVHKAAEFIHHDITGSEEFLRKAFAQLKVEYVFNYAAWPYIPDSFERPLRVFDVNATAAIKVINAAQEAGCKGVLQVSSAEIYGEVGRKVAMAVKKPFTEKEYADAYLETGRIKETDQVLPHSTYGAAKAAVDYYCQCAWKERKTPVIALRQFNCLGERETHPYVVPEIISQLAAQQDCKIVFRHPVWRPKVEGGVGIVELGNNSFRDFLYAGDAVRIAVELLERGQFGEVYNLGSEDGIKIYDLARRIGKLMGFESVEVVIDTARKRPWEIWHLQSCNDKLVQALGKTHSVTPLDEALERTINDYRTNGNRWCWEKR